jgi:hypothetical protein
LTSVRLDLETTVVDANVFYSQYQRNVFMTLAVERLFNLHWTDEIEAGGSRPLSAIVLISEPDDCNARRRQ